MGAKESRASILSYEEANKRVTDAELKRLQEAYKRACGFAGVMKEIVFVRDVLGDNVPTKLAQRIFAIMSSSSRGMTFRDLLVTLTLLTRGRSEERIKLVFAVYCDEHGSYVTSQSMSAMVSACEKTALPFEAFKLFKTIERVTFDQFRSWIMEYSSITSVTRWLINSGGVVVSLTDHTEMPNFYQTLAGVTHLEECDITELEKRYWQLKSQSKSGRFDLSLFETLVTPPLPKSLVEGLFTAFDENKDGHVDFKEISCGVSACCRGPTAERQKFCFKIFDLDHDGKLNSNELYAMAENLVLVEDAGLLQTSFSQQTSKKERIEEVLKRTKKHSNSTESISLEEYQMWSIKDEIPNNLLKMIIEICHVILGLQPSNPHEEGSIIRGWLERSNHYGFKPGDTWNIVSLKWWRQWLEYTDISSKPSNGLSSSVSTENMTSNIKAFERSKQLGKNMKLVTHNAPGPIDNSDLVVDEMFKVGTLTDEGGKLKEGMVKKFDYEIVPEPVWRALHHWYGGSPSLPRIVPAPNPGESPWLEIYRVHVVLLRHQIQTSPQIPHYSSTPSSGLNTPMAILKQSLNYVIGGSTPKRHIMHRAAFSCRHTVGQVSLFLSNRLRIPIENMRLWHLLDDNNADLLEDDSAKLDKLGITNNSQILLEVRNADMSWPEELSQIARNHKLKHKGFETTVSILRGTSGLSNLGNTCFMNSSIQCLSNTQPLSQYFLEDKHLYELNRTNPLGLKGHIAKRYSDLSHELWSGTSKTVTPLKLRWTISKYAPRFNGFAQHDSQEFLAFVLDGLHEDLNRVKTKPYVTLEDSGGRPDDEVAQEAWDNHINRNQSIIVDLFHGQIRSQVRCLECNSLSVRFDPFTFLSLPLPMDNSMYINVTVLPLSGEVPTRYGLRLGMDETFLEIRRQLSAKCEMEIESILLAEVLGATIKNFLSDNAKVRSSPLGNIYAYEIPPPKSTPLASINKGVYPNGTAGTEAIQQEKNHFCGSKVHETNKQSVTNHLAVHPEYGDEEEGKNEEVLVKSVIPSAVDSSSKDLVSYPAYVIAFHRKIFHVDVYFLSSQKHRPSLFGFPVIVPCTPGQTNKSLYASVWKLVSRLVSPLSTNDGSINHAQDCDESLGSQFPFTLRCVQQCGLACGNNCPWFSFCTGCLIEYNDEPWLPTSGYIAIEWDPTALHLRYQPSAEKEIKDDVSVEEGHRGERQRIDLDYCLRAFTSEEELGKNELYHCGNCKKPQLAKKKLDIWRLPPILIIHLKRFQLVNGRWIKSHKVVDFPRSNFNPSSFMSSNDKSHKESGGGGGEHTATQDFELEKKNTGKKTSGTARCRKPSSREEDSPLYDLYAISCHSGIIGGGHYIAYAKNKGSGKWYCYNDSSCKEVSADNISVETAYTLFYQRQNIDYDDFMPSVEGKSPVNTDSMDDDFNSDYKRYCRIQ